MRNNQSLGHQTAISNPQSESPNDRSSIVDEDMKQHYDGVVETKQSCTNVVLGIDDDKVNRLSKERVNERRTAHCTPSLTNKEGAYLLSNDPHVQKCVTTMHPASKQP
jgi:hypothetical protein